jgi:hypothetical protein
VLAVIAAAARSPSSPRKAASVAMHGIETLVTTAYTKSSAGVISSPRPAATVMAMTMPKAPVGTERLTQAPDQPVEAGAAIEPKHPDS